MGKDREAVTLVSSSWRVTVMVTSSAFSPTPGRYTQNRAALFTSGAWMTSALPLDRVTGIYLPSTPKSRVVGSWMSLTAV